MSQSLEELHYGLAFRHAAATPLSSLLLNLEMTREHQEFKASPYVQQALQSAYRLQKLFELPGETAQKINIKTALNQAQVLIQSTHPGVNIHTSLIFPDESQILGNEFYFQEAVICVLNNSIESYRLSKDKSIRISGSIEQNRLNLSFTDAGVGMNWLEKQLVFADGFSSKRTSSGLGLTWVRQVIINHFNGEIKLISKKGVGTTLIWKIPLN